MPREIVGSLERMLKIHYYDSTERIWGFPKIRGSIFGGPHNKDCSISGSILGAP